MDCKGTLRFIRDLLIAIIAGLAASYIIEAWQPSETITNSADESQRVVVLHPVEGELEASFGTKVEN